MMYLTIKLKALLKYHYVVKSKQYSCNEKNKNSKEITKILSFLCLVDLVKKMLDLNPPDSILLSLNFLE